MQPCQVQLDDVGKCFSFSKTSSPKNNELVKTTFKVFKGVTSAYHPLGCLPLGEPPAMVIAEPGQR